MVAATSSGGEGTQDLFPFAEEAVTEVFWRGNEMLEDVSLWITEEMGLVTGIHAVE